MSGASPAYIRCASCERVCPTAPGADGTDARCTRCGAKLQHRKTNSLARSWALVIAAIVCYVPANLLPVMVVAGPGGSEADTILSGVQAMFAALTLLAGFYDRAALWERVEGLR